MRNLLKSAFLIITLCSSTILSAGEEDSLKNEYNYSYDFIDEGVHYVCINGETYSNSYHSNVVSPEVYSFISYDGQMFFANICGKKYGPYSTINGDTLGTLTPIALSDNGNFAFYFTKNKRRWMNINGKEYGPYPNVDLSSVNVYNDGSFTFTYLANSRERYVIINEKRFGPFPNMSDMKSGVAPDGSYFYEYSDTLGNYYVNVNGREFRMEDITIHNYYSLSAYTYKENNKYKLHLPWGEEGPYDEIIYIGINQKEREVAYSYRVDKSWFLKDGADIYGPYKYLEPQGAFYLYNGKVVFKYTTPKGIYINISGNSYGPYNYIKRFTMTPSGTFGYIFEENKKWYVNIDGKIKSSGYMSLNDLFLSDNGEWAFSYQEGKNESYIKLEKGLIGPKKGYIDEIFLDSTGNPLYLYSADRNSYVSAFGNELGPFAIVDNLAALSGGEYAFSVSSADNSRFGLIINGIMYGPFDKPVNFFIGDGGKYIFSVQADKQNYVSVNGSNYGPYSKIERFRVFGNWRKMNLLKN